MVQKRYDFGHGAVIAEDPSSNAESKDFNLNVAMVNLQRPYKDGHATFSDGKSSLHTDCKQIISTAEDNILKACSALVSTVLGHSSHRHADAVLNLTLTTLIILTPPLVLLLCCAFIRQTSTKVQPPPGQSIERDGRGLLTSQARGLATDGSTAAGRSGTLSPDFSSENETADATFSVLDWWSGPKTLCSELIESSERFLIVKSLNQASHGSFHCHDVVNQRGDLALHVRLRPGSDEGSSVAGGPPQPGTEVLELLTEEQGEILSYCCMPSSKFAACADIFKRDGKLFGQVYAELEYKRFVLRFPEGKWMITGDFAANKLRIANHQGQPIAWTSGRSWRAKSEAKKIEVHVAPEVDAGLVLCGLLVVDRTFGVGVKI